MTKNQTHTASTMGIYLPQGIKSEHLEQIRQHCLAAKVDTVVLAGTQDELNGAHDTAAAALRDDGITVLTATSSWAEQGKNCHRTVDARLIQMLQPGSEVLICPVVPVAEHLGLTQEPTESTRVRRNKGIEGYTVPSLERAGMRPRVSTLVDHVTRTRIQGTCQWDLGWGWLCGRPAADGVTGHACDHHANISCRVRDCTEPATKICHAEVINLFCGAPLCNHHSEADHH